MKYEDPIIDETIHGNVNVSSEAPLRTFVKLSVALTLIVIAIYFLLNLLVFQLIRYIDFETEEKWFGSMANSYTKTLNQTPEEQAKSQALQAIADKLIANAISKDVTHPLSEMTITIHYSDATEVNAFAMPAGHIVVMQGLIDAVANENVLAMVIGHEIAHVIHRDSLTRMGRMALSNLVLMSIFGAESAGFNRGLFLLESGHSRSAESRADQTGLRLMHGAYGNAYGATQLFDAFQTVNPSESRWIELSASHPLPVNRRNAMQEAIQENGYPVDHDRIVEMPSVLE